MARRDRGPVNSQLGLMTQCTVVCTVCLPRACRRRPLEWAPSRAVQAGKYVSDRLDVGREGPGKQNISTDAAAEFHRKKSQQNGHDPRRIRRENPRMVRAWPVC